MNESKHCRSCSTMKPVGDFTRKSSSPDGLAPYCKECAAKRRAARRALGSTRRTRTNAPVLRPVAEAGPTTTARTDYVPSAELMGTWAAVQLIVRRGGLAPNMLFLGPSGAGKTEAARHLAAVSGLPFTKVDAPSVTDPEAWFGTREVVVEDGAPKTIVTDSAFVSAVTRRGVLLIDEVNRIADGIRGILLSLFDDSRAVTNPLTGQPVVRHPECYVVMTGNAGLAFTGTYAIDPAFLTRALTTVFDYLDVERETALAISRTGVDETTAALLVRFASETRSRSRATEDFPPISTREVLEAARLISVGLDANTAVHQVIINASSGEGGAESVRAQLEMIWTGIRPK